jgi:hypothetical protein
MTEKKLNNTEYYSNKGLFRTVKNQYVKTPTGYIPYCNICKAPYTALNYFDEFIWNGNKVTLPADTVTIAEIETYIPVLEKVIENNKKLPKPVLTKKSTPKKLMLTYKDQNINVLNIMKKWASLNPSLEISLYDDNQCYVYLYQNYNETVANRFMQIPDGPIKADYFRVHYMYLEGGFYADCDIDPIESVEKIISEDKFVTIDSANDSELNPMFFSCCKEHIVLQYAITIYDILFTRNLTYFYWDFSIVKILSFIRKLYPFAFEMPLVETIVYRNRHDDHIKDRSGNLVMYNRNKNYDNINHKYI